MWKNLCTHKAPDNAYQYVAKIIEGLCDKYDKLWS